MESNHLLLLVWPPIRFWFCKIGIQTFIQETLSSDSFCLSRFLTKPFQLGTDRCCQTNIQDTRLFLWSRYIYTFSLKVTCLVIKRGNRKFLNRINSIFSLYNPSSSCINGDTIFSKRLRNSLGGMTS